ncbi:ferric reductase [Baekduia soli]|uniref:Ferric reductase n=1 Tax=Baekduia soli TaxID=496014 RepID=A0A5B8U4R6_9ACTN|nr:ferric reductase-like transmembrane domain-containing protein [Baekduia soli]QEC47967.1 ferric reductase [Baekduia soli]
MTGPDPLAHGWWLASRASGLVALGLLTVAVLAGLVLGGRLDARPGAARAFRVLHEQAAVAGLIAVGAHGATLLGDAWLRPGLAGVLVPGAIGYRPLPVAAGIVAGYLAAALGLSHPLRRRIGIRRWRAAHRLTIVAYGLAIAHTITAGTDAAVGWVRWPTLAGAAAAGVLLVWRIVASRRRAVVAPGRVAAQR